MEIDWGAVEPPGAEGFMVVTESAGALLVGAVSGIHRLEGAAWTHPHVARMSWMRGAFGDAGGFACVVGDLGLTLASWDGGRSFERVDVGTDARLEGGVVRGDDVWLVGARGTVLRSTDRGRSFAPQVSGSQQHLSGICRAPEGHLLVSGTMGTLLRSDDGEAWRVERQKGEKFIYGVAADGELVVAPASGGAALVSVGGRDFSTKRTGTKGYFYAGASAAGGRAFAAGSDARRAVVVATDDGRRWAVSHPDVPDPQVHGVHARGRDEVWIATGGALLRGRCI